MNKIIVIGCPGSGKSTLSIHLSEILDYPVLHLDKIYHISNTKHISREQLIEKIISFSNNNEKWIIDGNYLGTLDIRINLCDTVILFNIDTKICVNNIYKRLKEGNPAMASGFDNSIMDNEFINFVNEFKDKYYTDIYNKVVKSGKHFIVLDNYTQMHEFIEKLSH